ncbi:uncharacterized protein BDZ99DRAFT_567463 [Mytilinidion resinicola]|uniref:Zn(2)-C6 fungal-type domain-containing protein n=1 Tax=Mytilinidion resinicola TaxID=574789 RepID=A0A6A6YY13_9PEZI|nr:uncharacterized protein BDZ99DRAFT_567463 [Mytilinidion resinicola]KAF2813711.1 hypothetical protein BDZ99DRAFT_567463 [Mytilinidion resinicola]
MESERLRALERQFKIRVKTGCTTCRIRRVKCDETKPACIRCTRTGRKCEGYTDAALSRKSSPAAAAAYRNSSFLSIPARASAPKVRISRNPSPTLFDSPAENRSFAYFQANTLIQWTEFFDSELWSQEILRMMFHEPAIKHGVLALSTMHEVYSSNSRTLAASPGDYAFKQYMDAVMHSNQLLVSYQTGQTSVETVLLACIIFVCYESLVGNYKAMNMHLRNGLRILDQHKHRLSHGVDFQDAIVGVLHRFDFQSMTFSDSTSPYLYHETAPVFPVIPPAYSSTAAARTDLVSLLRSMMWITNIATGDVPGLTIDGPEFAASSAQLLGAFPAWTASLEAYCSKLSPTALQDPKTYAGVTLLRIYCIMCQLIISVGSITESLYDDHLETFRTIIDLVATLPSFQLPGSSLSASPASSAPTPTPHHTNSGSSSSSYLYDTTPPPNPTTPPSASDYMSNSPPQSQLPTRSRPFASDIPPDSPPYRTPRARPASFSPSFELSPIVPLFLCATRCRDPILRRRAMELLLISRRREGVWDSVGAAGVGAEVCKIEEGLCSSDWSGDGEDITVAVPPLGWVRSCKDIPEEWRVKEVQTTASIETRTIEVQFVRYGGSIWRTVRF